MRPRYPTRWLMTDERMGEALWPALGRLPPGSGVVFRHGATPPAERRRLLRHVERVAAARRLLVVVSGGGGRAGAHGLTTPRPVSAAAHDRREAIRVRRTGAALVFVSPIHPTRSHPGAPALGPLAAARIAQGLGMTAIALGGMTERRWRRIARLGFDGWAAIDAWTL